jgi:hypothetical protein
VVTLEIPRLDFVQVYVFNDVEIYLVRRHLLPQVIIHELLVGRVEAKSRRDMGGFVHLVPLIQGLQTGYRSYKNYQYIMGCAGLYTSSFQMHAIDIS